jgi:cytochrome b561
LHIAIGQAFCVAPAEFRLGLLLLLLLLPRLLLRALRLRPKPPRHQATGQLPEAAGAAD